MCVWCVCVSFKYALSRFYYPHANVCDYMIFTVKKINIFLYNESWQLRSTWEALERRPKSIEKCASEFDIHAKMVWKQKLKWINMPAIYYCLNPYVIQTQSNTSYQIPNLPLAYSSTDISTWQFMLSTGLIVIVVVIIITVHVVVDRYPFHFSFPKMTFPFFCSLVWWEQFLFAAKFNDDFNKLYNVMVAGVELSFQPSTISRVPGVNTK